MIDSLIYQRDEIRVYRLGSTSTSKSIRFNSHLSDLDLLFVPNYHTIDDYTRHMQQAVKMSTILNDQGAHFADIFMLSAKVSGSHLKCLSVLAGIRMLSDKDMLFGEKNESKEAHATPNVACRSELYKIKALSFSREYQLLLPVADTGKARKTAKQLLRAFKVLICASTPTTKLLLVEEKLLNINSFSGLKPFISQLSDISFDFRVFQDSLDGKTVDDWPEWMIAQEDIARWLTELEVAMTTSINDSRFYGGICQVRDMLILGLKDVFLEHDDKVQAELIGEYADNTASVIVKLALSNVEMLTDFSTSITPNNIKESYQVLVDHLKHSRPTLRCLAASVIMLEYAFEQSILKANKISSEL